MRRALATRMKSVCQLQQRDSQYRVTIFTAIDMRAGSEVATAIRGGHEDFVRAMLARELGHRCMRSRSWWTSSARWALASAASRHWWRMRRQPLEDTEEETSLLMMEIMYDPHYTMLTVDLRSCKAMGDIINVFTQLQGYTVLT